QPIVILTPDPGMARHRISRVGCVGSRGKNFRSSRSTARISGVRCAGSKSPICLCVLATEERITTMALVLQARRRAGSLNTGIILSRQNCGCAAGSCRLYRNRFDAGQVAEKDSYASFHSTDFASTYDKSTPPLIDLRAPRLSNLFEQPARRGFCA